jgi:protein ImuB
LNNWPIERVRRKLRAAAPRGASRREEEPPLVIVRTVAERQVIVAACGDAEAAGIRVGLTLTQARALHAGVVHVEHEPEKDRRGLAALGRWMMRFSPVVALACDSLTCDTGVPPVRADQVDHEAATSQSTQHGRDARGTGLFLDVTGCERLFRGLHNLVRLIVSSLARMGLSARVAVAPTPGGAWALTFAAAPPGPDRFLIVPQDRLEAALAPLPAAALRIEDDLADALHHLGISTIGQLMELPREVLPARFGPALLERLDEALGRVAEPLVPLEDVSPIGAGVEFDGAVSSLEVIWAAFQQTVGRVIRQLARRGRGARRLEVEFVREAPLPPIQRSILLSRPSRDPVNLFNLFRCATEDLGAPPPAPRSRLRGRRPGVSVLPSAAVRRVEHFQSEGFIALRLAVPLHEPLADEQIALLGHEAYAGQQELDRLIERLRVRLGESAVVQAELVESHVPERGWREGGEKREDRGWRIEDSKGSTRGARRHALSSIFYPLSSSPPPPPYRPLHLLPTPTEVRVMVSPSDDREGRPVMFAHEGSARRVAHFVGPERIAGRWWDGHDKTRDYFDVQDPQGRRFWIFRVTQTGKWYLHGVFE